MQKTITTIIILFAVFLPSYLFAQPQKGDYFIGLSLSKNSANSIGTIHRSPFDGLVFKGGKFIGRNIAIGSSLKLGGTYIDDNAHKFNFRADVFARYYFRSKSEKETKKMFWFLEAASGYGMNYHKNGFYSDGNVANSFDVGLGGGFQYFFTPNLSMEGLFRVDNYNIRNSINNRHIHAEIGMQYFFRKKPKKQAKTGF